MTLMAPTPETETLPLLTAVTYQRVSTKEQASKGGRDEGFSIPAQREANTRKAESLGCSGRSRVRRRWRIRTLG